MNHELTTNGLRSAQEAFRRALDAAQQPYRMGQMEFFSDDEEQFIQHEVERKLHKPKLPNAGSRERVWLEKLKSFSRDESLVIVLKVAAGQYASALESLLPRQEFIRRVPRTLATPTTEAGEDEAEEPTHEEAAQGAKWLTLPGYYYTGGPLCPLHPVTPKTNKGLWSACIALKQEAGKKDLDKRWLADFLLAGVPQPVANFKMECLYLLRGADGKVTRLVRLVNVRGEMSRGPEAGGTDVLPAVEFSSAEKFRAWCKERGNFDWGVGESAGNLELQMFHADVSSDAAYRVARLIEYCGWHGVRSM